jgi:hypothetical protein
MYGARLDNGTGIPVTMIKTNHFPGVWPNKFTNDEKYNKKRQEIMWCVAGKCCCHISTNYKKRLHSNAAIYDARLGHGTEIPPTLRIVYIWRAAGQWNRIFPQ